MQRCIHVIVFKRSTRRFFEAQWRDPESGKKFTRSTGKDNRRDAERWGGQLERKLNAGMAIDTHRVKWERVVERYRNEFLSGLAEKTQLKAESTINRIERQLQVKLISSLNESLISRFTGMLRAEGLAEATVKGHLAEIRKLLRWCFDLQLIERLPKLNIPRKTARMKGRPITEEEFDRMVGVVPAVVASSCSPWDRPAADVAAVVDSWLFILRGLWWSGLRLTEAMLLHWTDPREITVQLDGRYPMFAIDAQADKGRVDRVFPIAPEFAEMLLAVPEDERHGYVFNPLPLSPDYHERLLTPWVSRVITAFGEAAGIKVAEPQGRFRYRAKPELYFDEHGNQIPREPMVKFASAHDLRRAFGARWSFRVMPPVLQQMMRHERLETTMEFYVGRNAEMAAAAIYEAYEQAMAAGATCERAH